MLYVSSACTREEIIWSARHLPLGGSHSVFVVLYCTTAEKHSALYNAQYSVLQQPLQAVNLQTHERFRCLLEAEKTDQNIKEKTLIPFQKVRTADAFWWFHTYVVGLWRHHNYIWINALNSASLVCLAIIKKKTPNIAFTSSLCICQVCWADLDIEFICFTKINNKFILAE